MKVFYSWQSDLENQYNRGFIKDALDQAIQELNRDLVINEVCREQIELDHDTKNTPGTPDLAGAIYEKISASTVFIADISFVAERLNEDKIVTRKVANPNVLIELGYALAKLGSDRVICLLNTSSGSTEALPFDLSHKRYPIQYNVDKNSTREARREQKQQLVKTCKDALTKIIDFEEYRTLYPDLSVYPSKENIINTIMSSDSKDDWEATQNINSSTRYFKKNINLRFEHSYGKEGIQCKEFREQWANRYPDPSATGYWHDLYYNSTLIERFTLVAVDGGKALLPLPQSSDKLVVSLLSYKIAQIYDILGTLDMYMIRSGLKLQN